MKQRRAFAEILIIIAAAAGIVWAGFVLWAAFHFASKYW